MSEGEVSHVRAVVRIRPVLKEEKPFERTIKFSDSSVVIPNPRNSEQSLNYTYTALVILL